MQTLADSRPPAESAPNATPSDPRCDPQCDAAPAHPPAGLRPFHVLKSAADRLVALACLSSSCLPVMIAAGLLVKLTSRGRCVLLPDATGPRRAPFTIYKIRTMYHNCESPDRAQWATPGDPRITPVGRFLRARTSTSCRSSGTSSAAT